MPSKKHLVVIGLMVYDFLAAGLSYLFGLWLRFDCSLAQIPDQYFWPALWFAPAFAFAVWVIFVFTRMYSILWRYAGLNEFLRLVGITLLTGVLHALIITLIFGWMPVSYYLFGPAIQFCLTFVLRLGARVVWSRKDKPITREKNYNILVIGAGNAGRMILQDISRSAHVDGRAACVIDDDPT